LDKILIWERAALQLDMGHTRVAVQILKANPPEGGNPNVLADYEQKLGEALCLEGQTKEGLVQLKKAQAVLDTFDLYPYSPDYGRIWGDLGLCTLAAGARTTALSYAAKARKVFAIQPGVSSYYKKPLQNLERLLGNHPAALKG
jgi:hypothetical protein